MTIMIITITRTQNALANERNTDRISIRGLP